MTTDINALGPARLAELRAEIRRVTSNAYYDARNARRTMEQAADAAADAVMEILVRGQW